MGLSAETKAKISAAKMGHEVTPATREKIRLAKLGKKRPPFSEEWKANMSAIRLRPDVNA